MIRGEIWWVDFGVPFGSEVGLRRPVIILQNDILNASKLRTVVVLPLTTNTLYADLPENMILEPEKTGLKKIVVTQPHLIVHIDKMRLVEKVKKLKPEIIEEVFEGVINTLS